MSAGDDDVCVGRLAAGDDADAHVTSRPRDALRRHRLVWTVPQQHHAHRPLSRRELSRTLRSVN